MSKQPQKQKKKKKKKTKTKKSEDSKKSKDNKKADEKIKIVLTSSMEGGQQQQQQQQQQKTKKKITEKKTRKEESSDTDADSTGLTSLHALGFKGSGTSTIFHLEDDERIIYQIGQHIAEYNYQKLEHLFLTKRHKVKTILNFTVSKGGTYIALSEHTNSKKKNEKYQVSIYNLKEAKRIRSLKLESGKSAVVAMDFSVDSIIFVAATEQPENGVYVWNLEQNKRLGFIPLKNFHVLELKVSPYSDDDVPQISAISATDCRVIRFEENEFKTLDPLSSASSNSTNLWSSSIRDNSNEIAGGQRNLTTHEWFHDKSFLVGTANGDVLVVKGFKLVRTIGNIFGSKLGVCKICCIERGFIAAGEAGCFSVYERTYDRDCFRLHKPFQSVKKKKIIDICISKREENVICACEDNEMLFFNFSNVHIKKEKDPNNFVLLPIGFHSQLCVGLDLCVQKSLLITCGEDNTIRIWNYLKKTTELVKRFDEDINSVSLHPNGMQILVGFRFKLCLFSILNDDIYKCCDWPYKGCKCVKFSKGGGLFAATMSTNIVIISTVTFQPLVTLRGHNQVVRDLVWGENDLILTSAGYDGSIFIWDIFNPDKQRKDDNTIKTCTFTSCFYDEQNNICGGIGNDKKLHCFDEVNEYFISLQIQLTSIALSKKNSTLFVGTSDGRVLLYNWPLSKIHFHEISLTTGKVTNLMLTFEEQFLIAVGEEKSLFVLKIVSKKDNRIVIHKPFDKLDRIDDLTYIMRSSLIEHENNISSLTEKMRQTMQDNDLKLESKEKEDNKKLEKQRDEYEAQIDNLKRDIAELKQQNTEHKLSSNNRFNAIEQSQTEKVKQFEQLWKEKLDNEERKLQEKEEELNEKVSRHVDTIGKLKNKHKSQLEKIKAEYINDKVQQIRSFNQLGIEYEEMNETFKEMRKQSNEDFGTQLEKQRQKYEKDLKDAILAREKHFSKVTELETDIKNLREELSKGKKTLVILEKEKNQKADSLGKLDVVRKTLLSDLKEKEDQNNLNEKKIQEQKNEISELEKLRFVLTFKYTSLQKEVAPQAKQITKMKRQLKKMDEELTNVGKEKKYLNSRIMDLEDKQKVLKENLAEAKTLYQAKCRSFDLFTKDLVEIVAEYDGDIKDTLLGIKDVISKFTGRKNISSTPKRSSKFLEFERQRDHMEAKISTLKSTLHKTEKNWKKDVNRKTLENTMLVSEVNTLRKEKKFFQKEVKNLEIKLRNQDQQLVLLQRTFTSKKLKQFQQATFGHEKSAPTVSYTTSMAPSTRGGSNTIQTSFLTKKGGRRKHRKKEKETCNNRTCGIFFIIKDFTECSHKIPTFINRSWETGVLQWNSG